MTLAMHTFLDVLRLIFSTHTSARRFLEIDLLRGVAILMMILYHILFDLWFFGIASVDVLSGFWRYFALTTATLFIALSGLSLPISYERRRSRMSGQALCVDFAKRGGKVFFFGMCATLATWLFIGDGFIVFGILHLIGFAIVIAPLFLRFGRWNIIPGLAIVLASLPLSRISGPYWLVWLGVHPSSFYSVDYVPVVPWLGVVLIGMAIGFLLYPGGKRRFKISLPETKVLDAVCLMGRNSLAIYLIHQPVIVAVLLAVMSLVG